MKVSLNQPNGFSTHFAPDKSKYLDSEGIASFTQPGFSTKRASSTPMSTTKDLWQPLPVRILLWLSEIRDSRRDTTSCIETVRRYSSSLIRL